MNNNILIRNFEFAPDQTIYFQVNAEDAKFLTEIQRFTELIPFTLYFPTYTGRGEGSAVFKLETSHQTYILKTALYPERTQKVLNEAKIRQEFIDKGLTFIPPPKYHDNNIFPKGVVLYDFIEGNQTRFETKELLHQMAQYLAAIHRSNFRIEPDGNHQIAAFYQSLEDTIASIRSRYPNLMNQSIINAFSNALAEFKKSN